MLDNISEKPQVSSFQQKTSSNVFAKAKEIETAIFKPTTATHSNASQSYNDESDYLSPKYLNKLGAFNGVINFDIEPPTNTYSPIVKIKENRHIEWRKPNKPSSNYRSIFAQDSREMSKYYNNLRKNGLNISMEVDGIVKYFSPINASSTLNNVNISNSQNSKQLSTSETFLSIYNVISKISFSLFKDDVVLHDNAREEVLSVKDDKSACEFFSKFGTHIRLGTFELGGIWLCTAKASSRLVNNVITFRDASLLKLKATLGLNMPTVIGGLQGTTGGNRDRAESSTNESSIENIALDYELTHVGPIEDDPKMFAQKLNDKNEYRIIQYPCGKFNFWPVWELLERDSDERVRDAAKRIEGVFNTASSAAVNAALNGNFNDNFDFLNIYRL